MAVFDTPITTDGQNLEKVLRQHLPVVLYLYSDANKALDAAFNRAAKANAGEILVARVDVNANPQVHERYGQPALPALLTLDGGDVESRAGAIQPADVDAHVDFLLGQGPLPTETVAESAARASSGAAPVHVRDTSFAVDVLRSEVPVLVDFWAPWCGPCHMVAPILDRLAQQYAGQIKIAKLNVDENPQMAYQYQAMSIPMLMMFKNGQPVDRLVGAHPQGNIEQMIRRAL
ncbi:MAG: thioredoxin [Chloroflexi bacterium]|nr:thioredoxin [Chloroflexota bacterium]